MAFSCMRCWLVYHLSMMASFLINVRSPVTDSAPLETTDRMYEKILSDPLVFGPEFSPDARHLLTGLLTRDPTKRLGSNGADDIKRHPFFAKHLDFHKLLKKRYQPPFKPIVASPVVRRLPIFRAFIVSMSFYRTCPILTPCLRQKNPLTVSWKVPSCPRQYRISSLVCYRITACHLARLLTLVQISTTMGQPPLQAHPPWPRLNCIILLCSRAIRPQPDLIINFAIALFVELVLEHDLFLDIPWKEGTSHPH